MYLYPGDLSKNFSVILLLHNNYFDSLDSQQVFKLIFFRSSDSKAIIITKRVDVSISYKLLLINRYVLCLSEA